MIEQNNDSIKNYIILYLLLPVVLLTPFFRGLYFDKELLLTVVYVTTLFIFLIFRQKGLIKIKLRFMDFSILGLVVAFIISLFFAIEFRSAIGETIRVVFYALIYLLVVTSAKNHESLKKLSAILFLWEICFSENGLSALCSNTIDSLKPVVFNN